MPLESRIRTLEKSTSHRTPLLIYIPAGIPTPEQQAEIEQAKRDRRPLFPVNESDAEI
jgi:hypothetical protein